MSALWSWMQVVDMNPSRVMFEIEKLVLQISQSILKVRTRPSLCMPEQQPVVAMKS